MWKTIGVALGVAVCVSAADVFEPVHLKQSQLGGEIGRRIDMLVYTNQMGLNLQKDFIEPFYTRPVTNGSHYLGTGKVIDSGALFAAFTGDEKVRARTAELIDAVLKSRDETGYIGMFKPEPGATQNGRNWVLHEQEYLILGLTDFYRFCGDTNALIAAKTLANYVLEQFPKNKAPQNICTAGLPEAMLVLYGVTGDKKYLDFAADTPHGNNSGEIKFASLRTWHQTFEQKPAHVYVMLARCYAQMRLFRITGEKELQKMSRYMRQELLKKNGGFNVAGSASDGEHFSYTQNGVGNIGESCVTAYLIRWLEDWMRLEGNLQTGDLIERTIYNALFAAQSPDGRRLRYFTPLTGPREWYGRDGFCCPGNYRRIAGELPGMVYYRISDGVAVNLYTSSECSVDGLALRQETDYPTTGVVKITITAAPDSERTLRLRIPRWAKTWSVKVNGTACESEIRRKWKSGDVVNLELPMTVRLVRGRQLQEGKVALMRGPQLFCLGGIQNEALLKAHPDFKGVVVDPATFGDPEPDCSVRPDGLLIRAKALIEAKAGWGKATTSTEVVFTEFADPSGLQTYFSVLDLSGAVEDELIGAF